MSQVGWSGPDGYGRQPHLSSSTRQSVPRRKHDDPLPDSQSLALSPGKYVLPNLGEINALSVHVSRGALKGQECQDFPQNSDLHFAKP